MRSRFKWIAFNQKMIELFFVISREPDVFCSQTCARCTYDAFFPLQAYRPPLRIQ